MGRERKIKNLHGDGEHACDLLILSMTMSLRLYRSNRTKVYKVREYAYDLLILSMSEHALI